MGLKILIVIEFVALLAALSSGLVFLLKDVGVAESKRALYALGTRVSLVALLMLTVAYGIHSGQLKNNAPWAAHRYIPSENTESNPSQRD